MPRLLTRSVIALGVSAALVSIVACSSSAEDDHVVRSANTTEEVIDMGCPKCEACGEDDAGPSEDTDAAVPIALADHKDSLDSISSRPLGKWVGVDGCKALLAKAKDKITVCGHVIAICATLTGNPNGAEAQKFCAALGKIASLVPAAKDEAQTMQSAACSTCSNKIVACADGGAVTK